jgi:4-hydroxy-tetrahydrodipicolinate synthase
VTADELETLVGRVVGAVDGRVPVIGGSGTNSTAKTIELTRRVARAGADAALVVTPYYNKPMQAGLLAHYRAVADAAEVPVVLYNVPGRTACDLKPETAAALAAHERIVGLKEALPEPGRWRSLKELCPPDFCLLSGDDATAMDFMLGGGDGVISVTANVAPRLMHGLCEAALAGERRKAASIDDRLRALHGALFLESSPIPVKWAVSHMGLIGRGIRLPLTWLAAEHEGALQAAMQAAGVGPV